MTAATDNTVVKIVRRFDEDDDDDGTYVSSELEPSSTTECSAISS